MTRELTNRQCPNCGSPEIATEPGRIRCTSCGSALRWSDSGNQLLLVTPMVVCPLCGRTSEPGRRFCRECGGALSEPCPRCGEPNPTGSRYCGDCQYPLAEMPDTCPRCGRVQPASRTTCEACELPLCPEPRLEWEGPTVLDLGRFRAAWHRDVDAKGGVSHRLALLPRTLWWLFRDPAAVGRIVVRNRGGRILEVRVDAPGWARTPASLSIAAGEEVPLRVTPDAARTLQARVGRDGSLRVRGGRRRGVLKLAWSGGCEEIPLRVSVAGARLRSVQPADREPPSLLYSDPLRSGNRRSLALSGCALMIILGILASVGIWIAQQIAARYP